MRSRWLGLVVALILTGLSIWAYPQLPDRMATHWNLGGEPDGYSSRLLAVSLMPLITLGVWGLMQVFPKIDPKGENYAKFIDTYWLIVNGLLVFMAAIHLVLLGNGLGWPVDVGRLVPIGLGLLFVLIGNYLSRIQPNWFIGIRTPWTLSSESVWRKTHRMGGWLFVIGGLVTILLAFIPKFAALPLVVVTLAIVSVVPVVQSYLLWRREQRASR